MEFSYGVVADVLATKGVLYTRIDITSIGGKSLHLLTTHTQATYPDDPVPLYAETIVCRYEQIKQVRDFAYQ